MPVRFDLNIFDFTKSNFVTLGGITFGDFMDFLSTLSKGSEKDKILWTFQFYDVNSDGCISRDEMMKVSQVTDFHLVSR